MSSLTPRLGAFVTFSFCLADRTGGRAITPPVVVVVFVLVWVLAPHAGLDRAYPGALAVLAAVMAELLVGRRFGGTGADQGL
ncbi:hypothetical protein AB0G73_06425 [Streptomyces sp. NPDC020719]|uniref:hypothetical protein n=1 Tax=Streptomyces sp. NPDC020719 TaxID=3154896 RepID=UPI0034029415